MESVAIGPQGGGTTGEFEIDAFPCGGVMRWLLVERLEDLLPNLPGL